MKFISKKTLLSKIEYVQRDNQFNREEYRKLRAELWALMDHLGIKIEQEPSRFVCKKKE